MIDLLRYMNGTFGFYWTFVIFSVPLIPVAVLISNIINYDKRLYCRISDAGGYISLTPALWVLFSLGSVLSFAVSVLTIVFGGVGLMIAYFSSRYHSESVLRKIEEKLSGKQ